MRTSVAEQTRECPSCGYDLRSLVSVWQCDSDGAMCPLEGQCAECGSRFRWRDVFDPLARSRARLNRKPRTLIGRMIWLPRRALLLLRPRQFWIYVGVPKAASVRIAILGTACLIIAFAVALAALNVASVLRWSSPYPLLDTMVLVSLSPYADALVGHLPTGRFIFVRIVDFPLKAGLLVGVLAFACTWLFGLALILRDTRRHSGISVRQVVIATVYSLNGIAVTIAVWIGFRSLVELRQLMMNAIGHDPFRLGRYLGVASTYQIQAAAVAAIIWMMWWWHNALTKGWAFRQARTTSYLLNWMALASAVVCGCAASIAADLHGDSLRVW